MSAAEKSILEKDLTMAFIDFDVEMLERYLTEVEDQWDKARERKISEYRDRLQHEGKAQREEPTVDLEAIGDSYEQFVHFQRYAFLMLVFMIFEARAKELCKYVRERKQLSLELGDLRGNLPEMLKSYLCRYAKVLDKNWRLWQDVRELQLVRHQIAHQGGICTKEEAKKKFKPLVRKVPGLRVERDFGGFLIELNLDSCRYAISTIKRFFEQAGRKAGFRNED
jgi:hypothetical protein